MGALLDRLIESNPDIAGAVLPAGTAGRLEKLSQASRLYGQLLLRNPGWVLWLEKNGDLARGLDFAGLNHEWGIVREELGGPPRNDGDYLAALRRFRRKICLRIAYRILAEAIEESAAVVELSHLADFCIRECYFIALEQWSARLGAPWDEELDAPARFCCVALGKLGGEELNFSSDVDLLFVYEGEGHTRISNEPTSTSNAEFFHRLGEAIARCLNQQDAAGFLFRVDLRLRPGGDGAPLVPSFGAVENYYAAMGQTWERLVLIKSRPIAGDLALGGELLETLHSFRYPRHPPPSLVAEVAMMKTRTENEVVGGEALSRDVKSGYGGIREIEFVTQTLQLLHGARFPFLQTNSTIEALRQLVRYELLGAERAVFLEQAYWFLRSVEHRLQMADEHQTHQLPADDGAREIISRTMGFETLAAFEAELGRIRDGVRNCYQVVFGSATEDLPENATEWWTLFADGRPSPPIEQKIQLWFHDPSGGEQSLTNFVRGSQALPLGREQVQRFLEMQPTLDRIMPTLARPGLTLKRIATFGERYGSRKQFLSTCALNPDFFEVLALLFDRSSFIHSLLRLHPEIFDEVLRPEILHTKKDIAWRRRELAEATDRLDNSFARWLWLYVRAEQVRTAIGNLLGLTSENEAEAGLSDIAEATLLDLRSRIWPAEELLFVAMGKLGGRELSFGSDLDLVFVSAGTNSDQNPVRIRRLRQNLSATTAHDATFDLDLRLRPHGEAGAPAPGIDVFRNYFRKSAQPWERQALTRARTISGPPEIAERWQRFIDETVYERPLAAKEADGLWSMRLRVQHERDPVQPRERAFKTGAGGLVDVEFALQILQMKYGAQHPAIRTANTRQGWRELATAGLVENDVATLIQENHQHLKRIEWCLRRDLNRSVTVLPDSPEEQTALARWLGAANWATFWSEHRNRMIETRKAVSTALSEVVSSTTLECGR